MIKTNFRHLENPKGIENKFEKNSVSPIIGLDHESIKWIIYDMSDKSSPQAYSFTLNGFLCNYRISLWLFFYPEQKSVHLHRSEHLFELFNGPCTLPDLC